MNEYAQGFNISSEEIAVFVRVARKAADVMNISISELFGKLESYARAMEAIGAFLDSILNAIRETVDDLADIMQEIAVLELPPPLSKLERQWRAQRRRAERERMRVFLKYLEFLFVIRKYKPP